jgi:hypothetical protein
MRREPFALINTEHITIDRASIAEVYYVRTCSFQFEEIVSMTTYEHTQFWPTLRHVFFVVALDSVLQHANMTYGITKLH